jgi:hypothetical protein
MFTIVFCQHWTEECGKLGGCKYDFVPFHWYGFDPKAFAKELVSRQNGMQTVGRHNSCALVVGRIHQRSRQRQESLGHRGKLHLPGEECSYTHKPIMSQWACIDYSDEGNPKYCSAAEAKTFMDETVKAMKAQPAVERYSWQGAFRVMNEDKSSGQPRPQGPIMMNEDGSLNELGQHYRMV